MHWHGMKLPARYDGGPHQPITPGAEWIAEWEIEQPAAICCYHTHTLSSPQSSREERQDGHRYPPIFSCTPSEPY